MNYRTTASHGLPAASMVMHLEKYRGSPLTLSTNASSGCSGIRRPTAERMSEAAVLIGFAEVPKQKGTNHASTQFLCEGMYSNSPRLLAYDTEIIRKSKLG